MKEESSFRDASGFVFHDRGEVLRAVNKVYQPDFDFFTQSGLYAELANENKVVSHEIVWQHTPSEESIAFVLRPYQIPVITYPYEWSFGQLKDAALLTLEIQKRSLEKGMILKDASAYNVQFIGSRPVFIDTLSFEQYREGMPWMAYRQFCQHFLAPLCLMSQHFLLGESLLKSNLDGIPLNIASALLPLKSKFRLGLFTHLVLHGKMIGRFAEDRPDTAIQKINKRQLLALTDSLLSTVAGCHLKFSQTVWSNYYQNTNYSSSAEEHKTEILKQFCCRVNPKLVLGIGANNGRYSRIFSPKAYVLSTDVDFLAVEQNYIQAKKENDEHLLPLVLDIANPSPGIGWKNLERPAFLQRVKPDLIVMLAVVHHLVHTHHLHFGMLAQLAASLAPYLIIEFVPPDDSQIKKLPPLPSAKQELYSEACFEKEFGNYYSPLQKIKINHSGRVLYLFQRKS
ncbi:MAG: SAM-dependent methyltransferase [Bacteroidetes bacterium]|nr:SAM-dependent methyltransferase [Bacteroidota bacterium]